QGRQGVVRNEDWLKRDEYNPFLHNAWMMMARSQYLNGDFTGAAATFYYISRHFGWLPETVTEAQLWQARCYVALDWINEAQTIIARIKPEQLTTKNMRNLYELTAASAFVRAKEWEQAIPHLKAAASSASGTQKVRLNFLLGQAYAALGRKQEAYKAYAAAAKSNSAPYRTKLNARIAQSEVYEGSDIAPEVNALRRMTRMGRNKDYLDQIYYAIGNLYLAHGDSAKAIDNYILAAEKSTRNGIEKAISNVTLGQVYFAQGRYDLAQPRFSEAVPQLPEDYPDYKLLKRRSDMLDELAVYSQNVTLQDSLLRLSAMPEEEQLAVINKIIEELKKKEKEEAEEAARAEYEANLPGDANMQGGAGKAPQQFQLNTDDSWYFYNTATVAAGRTEFQRRWGSRKLEDDWRRRNKASFSFDDFDSETAAADGENSEGSGPDEGDATAEQTEEEKEAAERANDPHYPEYYLAQIPKTDQDKQTANDVIQEGLFTMGSILRDKLEDFGAARTNWDQLLGRYPDNIYRLDVYYNLYMMYVRMGNMAEAEHWRQLILSDFADSKYGIALQDPNYIETLKRMPEEQARLYDEAYQAYLDNRNTTVHSAYEEMMRRYPLSDVMPKFMFLHALSYVTEKQPEQFNSTLREMLERYPDTDVTPLASAWLRGMAQGRDLQQGAANSRGMLWDIRLSTDSVGADGGPIDAAEFDFSPEQPQILVLVYPTDSVSANELLFQVARHNFSSFVVKDFDLEQMNFGRLGMLLIKGFANEAEVAHYRTVLGQSTIMTLPAQVTEVTISAKNFDTLISQGRTFEEYFNAARANALEEVEQAVLGE
ncbi:MAG: tetratricopeptide repeat protein, partial [Muribaculaceae bacterium]|nr:tetratricopeptide repeat protein [Muribaculaceae bacterium]